MRLVVHGVFSVLSPRFDLEGARKAYYTHVRRFEDVVMPLRLLAEQQRNGNRRERPSEKAAAGDERLG